MHHLQHLSQDNKLHASTFHLMPPNSSGMQANGMCPVLLTVAAAYQPVKTVLHALLKAIGLLPLP
jgi:hypothetical protein